MSDRKLQTANIITCVTSHRSEMYEYQVNYQFMISYQIVLIRCLGFIYNILKKNQCKIFFICYIVLLTRFTIHFHINILIVYTLVLNGIKYYSSECQPV